MQDLVKAGSLATTQAIHGQSIGNQKTINGQPVSSIQRRGAVALEILLCVTCKIIHTPCIDVTDNNNINHIDHLRECV